MKNITIGSLIILGSFKLVELLKSKPIQKQLHEINYFQGDIQGIQLLDNKNIFDTISERIVQSTKSIDITMFERNNDSTGIEIANKLLYAADRGVEINIFKDHLGSSIIGENKSFYNSDIHNKLKYHKNITLHDGIQITGKGIGTVDYNNHAKYRIFDKGSDKEVVIMGGSNVGNNYRNNFHDYNIEIKAKGLGQELENRKPDSKWLEKYGDSKKIHANTNHENSGIKIIKNIIQNGRTGGDIIELQIKPAFLELINSCKEELIIEMAYLGDPEITQSIIKKIGEGEKVTIIMPKEADIQDATNKKTINTIMKQTKNPKNLFIYQYQGQLHSKVFISDNNAIVGSANFNIQSTEIMGETSVLIKGDASKQTHDIVENIKNNLYYDIQNSEKVNSIKEINYNSVKEFLESKYNSLKRALY